MTEVKIPRAEIENIARSTLASDIDAIKKEGAERASKLETVEAKTAEIEKTLAEIERIRAEHKNDQQDSRAAGLAFDPSDRDDPCVRHFGLHYRQDRVTSVQSKTIPGSGAHVGAPFNARGLGLRLGLYLRARAHAVQASRTVEDVLKSWDAEWMIKQLETWVERDGDKPRSDDKIISRERALGTVVAGQGATLVPVEYSQEVIELLRNTTVFLSAGPVEIDLPPGGINMGRITAASTASYRNEAASVNASQPETGEFVMTPRDLFGIVPVVDRMLKVNRAEAFIRNELVRTMTQRLDLAALRGDGANDTPRGLRAWATDGTTPDRVQSSASTDATPTTAQLATDLRYLRNSAPLSNVPVVRPAIFTNPRPVGFLMYHVDDGDFPFRDEVRNGTIAGSPFYETNQIPNNLGTGSDETEMIRAEMSEIVHGVEEELTVEVFPGGTYNNASGTLVSGIASGQTVFRAKYAHDVRPYHVEAVTVLDSVFY